VGVIYLGFLLGGIAIISRIVYLQLAEGNVWREKAEKLALKNMIITLSGETFLLKTDGYIYFLAVL
jgi:hypothetical protein